jgi:hypothetical protein
VRAAGGGSSHVSMAWEESNGVRVITLTLFHDGRAYARLVARRKTVNPGSADDAARPGVLEFSTPGCRYPGNP